MATRAIAPYCVISPENIKERIYITSIHMCFGAEFEGRFLSENAACGSQKCVYSCNLCLYIVDLPFSILVWNTFEIYNVGT